jgi:hypothetical protein
MYNPPDRIWSMDVVPDYGGKGWAVRRAGRTTRVLKKFRLRRDAVERAMKVRTALYVFVFDRFGRVQYVKRTEVKHHG